VLIFRSQESLSALFVARGVGSCFEGIGSVDGAGADASARVFLARPGADFGTAGAGCGAGSGEADGSGAGCVNRSRTTSEMVTRRSNAKARKWSHVPSSR
jgi:hypothetical protein